MSPTKRKKSPEINEENHPLHLDQLSKKVLFFLILNIICLIITVFLIIKNYKKFFYRNLSQKKTHLVERDQKKEKNKELKTPEFINIGQFTIELKPIAWKKKTLNLAEVEVFLKCDKNQTAHYIEKNLFEVRDLLVSFFTPMERSELASSLEMKRMKTKMIKRLNQWLPFGKIEAIYFSKVSLP